MTVLNCAYRSEGPLAWRRDHLYPTVATVTSTPLPLLASTSPPSVSRTVSPEGTVSHEGTVSDDEKKKTLLVGASLAAVYLIWSSTYLALRYVVDTCPPLLSAGARFVLAGALLYGWLRLRGAARPSLKEWASAAAPGSLLFLFGNGFVAVAEKEVSSGLAAVACAAMPVLLAVFHAFGGERPSGREWVAFALGFAGVFLLGAGEMNASPGARAMLLCAPVGWALGSFLAKRLTLAAGLMGAATQMIGGGVACFIGGVVRGESVPARVPATALLALAYLVVFGSLVAFSAYSYLLKSTRPSVATSYAYVNPVLAVALGVAIAHERIAPTAIVATVLVVLAVATLALRRRPAKA